MSSLQQVIVNAIVKVSGENPVLNSSSQVSAEEARNEFIRLLLLELFPPVQLTVPVPVTPPKTSLPTTEPEAPKKKRGPKPKDTPTSTSTNIEKLNPVQSKKLKAVAEELKVDGNKKAVLEYLNSLTTEEFDNKKFEDHLRDFLTPPPVKNLTETLERVEVECIETEFEGETYYVDPVSKKVFKTNEDGNDEHVGDVGLAKFADLIAKFAELKISDD